MSAPTIQPQPQQHQQPKTKQPEPASSPEEEALKRNTDCVYFLASPLTCKKGGECEYRHSEYARVNPRDCYYWLSGNCLNPKCGFRHPSLEAPPGGSVKQPVPCVFFQKGMCAKGDMCLYMHTPNLAGYRKQHLAEAKSDGDGDDPRFSKKTVENDTGEKKLGDVSLPKAVKAHVDVSSGLRDSRGVEGYEPVVQKKGFNSTQLHGSDDSNTFHNGKDVDEALRESSPGFNVLVDNEARDSEYYHVEDGYGRRSQERLNSLNEYDGDGDGETFRDRHAWGHRLVSSERGDRSERRTYEGDERSENILASDLRYRLAKQRKVNGMVSVGSHDDAAAPDSSMERGYRDSRRNTPRESSISSSRLQGRIKLRERSKGEEAHFDRRTERGRDSSELPQGRLRDRIKGRLEENHSDNQERGLRAPWARRREMEDERRSETKSSRREESKTETSLGKRKSLEDHHPHKPSGDSFAAPLPFSEILKRKRAAASGGDSNNKDQTPQETISKEEGGEDTKLVTEEETEVVIEPKPIHEEAELEEGTIQVEGEEVIGEEEEQVYEGNEEEQGYEGDEVNGEYYYEEGYEEGGEYAYEEGEEVVYAAEEGEEVEGDEDIEKKTDEIFS
ncbi:unnamed protein product [Eruca vesicaria subsp. sativa]|uniref:C3H1-type domain-containing protein n=1 Tax=Eruca vesicaria subsp. sativa TaxID=29727 RepID=A0ABC8LIQ8_ERUVS|nr:unnamed protein product [Eruca vesicaria subsp. sativa]